MSGAEDGYRSSFQSVQDNLHELLTWFLSPKSLGLESVDGSHAAEMIARQIATGYSRFAIPSGVHTRVMTVAIPALVDSKYRDQDVDYLRPVLAMGKFARSELRDQLQNFILHGSLATFDYAKGWSDFDTFLVIRESTATNEADLIDVRMKLLDAYHNLLDIDPQQHHGFLVCTELDLLHYPATYMPLEALELGAAYFGYGQVTAHIVDTSSREQESLISRARFFQGVVRSGVLDHHAYRGERLLSGWRNADNGLYQFKFLVGSVALGPAQYFSAKGRPMSKLQAISDIRPLLSTEARETLEAATRVRTEWPRRERPGRPGNAIPEWVKDTMGSDYFAQAAGFHTELAQLLLREGSR